MPDDIEYVGLMAEAWDALRGDTSGWEDRAWFREVIRQRGEPVLDVGTGTGRLLLDFLAEGVDIDGIDNAPDMLERLHAKAAAAGLDVDGRVHLGRMQSLRLSRRYGTVIVPSSSFQLLLEPDDAAEAMRRFFALLLPGGSLAMPFIVMDTAYEQHWTKEATLGDGSIVRRTSTATFDPALGIEATDDLYEVLNGSGPVRIEHFVRPRATRAYTREQARALYETAGFVDLAWGADFTFEDREPDEIFTIVGRRPDYRSHAASPLAERCLAVITFGLNSHPGRRSTPIDACQTRHRVEKPRTAGLRRLETDFVACQASTRRSRPAPGQPPAASRIRSISMKPRDRACCSGVTPSLSAIVMSAP